MEGKNRQINQKEKESALWLNIPERHHQINPSEFSFAVIGFQRLSYIKDQNF